MSKPLLPPDDLPPVQTVLLYKILLRQLEEVIGKKFYQACGPITRVLLSNCHWYFKIDTSPLTMIIICYDVESYWHIANAIPHIVTKLKLFSHRAKIRFCPPIDKGLPWEIPVLDETVDDGE